MDPALVAGHVRRAMADFVASAGRRRRMPTCLHLGLPGQGEVRIPEQEWYDAGVRADLACRALEGLETPDPLAWLSRTGSLDVTDVDAQWLSACRQAYDRHDLPFPGLFLVSRRGWANLATGEQHHWSRVRAR